MKDIGIFLVKVSVFLFIGAGASVASIALPLMQYAKDSAIIAYEVEQKIGKLPSEEVCISEISKDSLAKCKTAVYTKKVLEFSTEKLNYWLFFSLLIGALCFIFGSIIYVKAVLIEKKAGISSATKI